MALNDLILRSESHPPLTTKGSELTYGELDGNFIQLYDYLSGMNSASGIAPYDNLQTYIGTEYVSFDGNIYVHISPTSTTGVFPNTDPTKWELTSIGALAHQQDKDSFLAFGSASQVSATDIYDILNNQIINSTFANFNTLKNTDELEINRLYHITNTNSFLDSGVYSNSQPKLFIRTIANNQYSTKGFFSILIPKYDTFTNYDYTFNYSIGDIVGYGLFVYECSNATINGDSPNLDTSNWNIKSSISFPAYYVTSYYDIEFSLEYGYIYVTKAFDKLNNTFGIDDFDSGNIATFQGIQNNIVDTTSRFKSYGFNGSISSNVLINTSQILAKGGYLSSAMANNFLNSGGIYCDEFINGTISGNKLTNANLNLTNGSFEGQISNVKIDFSTYYTLDVHNNASISGGYMNEQGSNIAVDVDIVGSTGDIDLESILTHSDIYGEFRFECNGERIVTMNKANYFCPIVIKPITAGQSFILAISVVSGTSNLFVSSEFSGDIELFADNKDYAVLERVNIGGRLFWNVTKISKVI
jgi:hypothetical protein